jgi:hexosaminidase
VTAVVVGVLAIVGILVVILARPTAEQPVTGAPPSPTPTRELPVPDGPEAAPRAIPEVRSWEAESGEGWAPTEETRVVTDPDGPLGAVATRLAEELSVPVDEGPARLGDVELRLRPDATGLGPEDYTLVSREGQVTITGSAEPGAFYGTRTLVQAVRDLGGVAEGVIRDAPDRPQRGLSLDIARKHFSAEWIADRLRLMADLKLNQLQLHFSDDQAFRIESERFPEIVAEEHLTKDEVRGLVELARSLYIEVIPEIDSPGHLGAVLAAHPELQLNGPDGPVRGAIDISDPRSAELIDALVEEFLPLFPGTYWHLGGDEYVPLYSADPETQYPGLAAAARDRHGPRAGVRDLATGWLNDRAETVRGHGRIPQVWNDGMHAGGVVAPDQEREVSYWTGREIGARPPEQYLEGGWKLINTSSEYLYYVLGEPVGFVYPTGERIFREWTPDVVRGNEPVPEELGGPERILGGRFAVWCDLADAQTAEEVAEGIRLPLHATAQKLWNPAEPALEWQEFVTLADELAAGGNA